MHLQRVPNHRFFLHEFENLLCKCNFTIFIKLLQATSTPANYTTARRLINGHLFPDCSMYTTQPTISLNNAVFTLFWGKCFLVVPFLPNFGQMVFYSSTLHYYVFSFYYFCFVVLSYFKMTVTGTWRLTLTAKRWMI